ncbi:tyrosine-type recombinase/integrase [Streptomyces mirabilis]|uniref:tyrosine-type recombinase/integrase n=1 Tax=Streptomyces mirabilis TaxID=68239 RepID=UPI00332F390B
MSTQKPRRSPGEGGAYSYQTASGTRWMWKATVSIGGVRKPKLKRGFLTKQAALKDMRATLAQSDAGTLADPGDVTVAEWLDTWLTGLRISPSTRQTYGQMIRVTLKPRVGGVKLAKLTSTRLNALYRELEATGSARGGPLAARSVRLAAAVMSMALKASVEAEPPLLSRNPAAKATPPRLNDEEAATPKAWSSEQLDAFLTWAAEHDQEHVAFWYVAATTGMRRGELLALDWRDAKGDVISVYRNARPGPGGKPVLGPTKTRKSRTVDLDEESVAVLKAWRVGRGGLHLSLVRDTAPIFGDENGKRLTPKSVSAAFDRAVARCRKDLGEDELPRLSLHGLRHTMVTTWLTAGVPVKVVAERTGHTVATMLTTYAHVIPGSQAAAAKQVAALRRQVSPVVGDTGTEGPSLRVVKGKFPGQGA